MTRDRKIRWTLLVTANVAFWCVLSLQQSHGANNQLNTADAIAAQQRSEIITELREIKTSVNNLVQYRRSEALPSAFPQQK